MWAPSFPSTFSFPEATYLVPSTITGSLVSPREGHTACSALARPPCVRVHLPSKIRVSMCNWTPLDRIWVWVLSLSGSSCEIHRNSLTHEEIKDQKGWITGLRSYNSVSIQIQCCGIIEFGLSPLPQILLRCFLSVGWGVGVTFLLILTKSLSVGLSSLFSLFFPQLRRSLNKNDSSK